MAVPEQPEATPMPEWLLDILVCPADRGSLNLDSQTLICVVCGRRYPVRDGIPVMIPEDADQNVSSELSAILGP